MATVIYAGFGVKVNVFDNDVVASSISVSATQNYITSESSYGGAANVGTTATGDPVKSPHFKDFSELSVSIDFYLNTSVLTGIVNAVKNRNTSYSITININGQSVTISDCFWESIAINCAKDDAVTCSVSFWTLASNLSGNFGTTNGENGSGSVSLSGLALIPYWATSATCSDYSGNGCLSWGVEFSQEVRRKVKCEHLVTYSGPNTVVIGNLSVSGQIEVLIANSTVSYGTGFSDASSVSYSFGGHNVNCSNLVVTGFDPVMDSGSPYSLQISFDSFSLLTDEELEEQL